MSTAPIVSTRRPSDAMDLLSSGVPLSLLLDLVFGPHSEELMFFERASGLPTRQPPTHRPPAA